MITDELRELAHVFSNVWLDKDGSVTYTTGTSAPSLESVNFEKHIKDIADRIDAKHEAMLADARKAVYQDYVELPKDADGVPIHIGDDVEEIDYDNHNVVHQLRVDEDGWWVIARNIGRRPNKLRHYHVPTVEDVLREFAYGLGVPVADSYVAACAAKLQLAGDAE